MQVRKLKTRGFPVAEILSFAVGTDNYQYIIFDAHTTIAIDATESGPVLQWLTHSGRTLDALLLTHEHHDHIGGLDEILHHCSCPVYGAGRRATDSMEQRQTIVTSTIQWSSLVTPGHSQDHLCFYFPLEQALFTGDVLFVGGCGRILQGTADQLYSSLQTILKLPLDTTIWCGHEYAVDNYRFAASLEPDNRAVAHALKRAEQLRREDKAVLATTLGEELDTNPFLRLSSPEVRKGVNCSMQEDEKTVFAAIRRLKDSW